MSDCNKGDLISRTALLQEFETEYACHNTELWHITGIKAFIENQPTVYAVEKSREAKAVDEFARYIADLIDDNVYGFVGKLLDTPYTTMLEVAQGFKNGVNKEDVDLER